MSRFGRRPVEEERSAEERERARWERERRRALREGREPPPEPTSWAPPPPIEPPLPREAAEPPATAEPPTEVQAPPGPAARDPEPAEPAAPAAWDPTPTEPPAWDPTPTEPPAWDPAPTEPLAAAAPPPAPDDPPPTEPLPRPAAPAADHLDQETVAFELPAPDPPVPAPPPPAPEPVREPEQGLAPPAGEAREPRGWGDTDEVPTAPVQPRRTVKLPRAAHGERPVVGTYVVPSGDEPAGTKTVHFESQPGAPGMPSRGLGVPPRRRRGVARRVLGALLVLALLVLALGAYRLFQPGYGPGAGRVAVTIPSGAGASEIGDILERAGVVESSTFFALRARLGGGEGLRSGPHVLKRDMPYAAALEALRRAPEAAPTITVTLPEGPSAAENAARVEQAGVRGDYTRAVRRARGAARELGLPRAAATAEGFLFPSTFELRRGATAGDLVERQLDAFRRQVGEVDFRAARRAKLSRYEVLTIASMVEREASVAKERPIIAGVIYNRLREGMPLGIDATIRYVERNWSRPLRVSELERDTPYNTRLRAGLPPTPIGNPGLASIRAAADPADHDFRFYVVKPCGRGAHAFSATDAEFQRDVAAYDRAREARGGKDPSRC